MELLFEGIKLAIGLLGVCIFTIIFVSAFFWRDFAFQVIERVLTKIWDIFWR